MILLVSKLLVTMLWLSLLSVLLVRVCGVCLLAMLLAACCLGADVLFQIVLGGSRKKARTAGSIGR